jgi:hypothetical protein
MATKGSARDVLAMTAALLDQGRSVDHLSALVTVAGLGALVATGLLDADDPVLTAALILSVLAGMAARYYGIRVGFDAALFHRLAESTGGANADLAALDGALSDMGFLAAAKAGKPFAARIAGARGLFYRLVAAAGIQILLILVGAAVAALS